jgi:hypothetical protein
MLFILFARPLASRFALLTAFSLPRAFPSSEYWTLAVAAGSLLAAGALSRTRWRATAGWAALALAGQAFSLQLLQVGNHIRPQLFFGWTDLLRSYRILFLAALALQALLVSAGVLRRRAEFVKACSRIFPLPAFLGLLVLQGLAAIGFAPGEVRGLVLGGFARAAAMQTTKTGLGLLILVVGTLNLCLAAASFPDDALENLHARWQRRNSRRLVWAAALWVVLISSLIAWLVLERMPHVPDEVAYVSQAKYLAAGRLYLETPPQARAFECEFDMFDGPKWYAATPAGWPALLALGFLLGVPWLVNPLLGGIAILLAHALVRRIYDHDVADGTVLLLAASPWLLFLSASLMPHPAGLVFSLLGLLGVERARNHGSVLWAAIAGLAIGALLHVRPLEAVIIAGVGGLWWLGAGWKKMRLGALAATVICGAAMTVLFLGYNHALTGQATYVPISKFTDAHYYPGANRLGFGKDIGNFGWTELDPLPGHGPIDVAVNTNINANLLNVELFGWPCGSVLLVSLLLLWRNFRDDALLWGLLLALWAGFSLYWFAGGPDFGPRYWYQMILPCVVLTVRGGMVLAQRCDEGSGSAGRGNKVWAFVLLASAIGLVNLAGWRSLDKYRHYRDVRPDVRKLSAGLGRSLVFVRGQAFPDYAAAIPFNPPTLDRNAPGPIFARDLGAESRAELTAYFSGRTVWTLEGPSVTGEGFRLLEFSQQPEPLQPSNH